MVILNQADEQLVRENCFSSPCGAVFCTFIVITKLPLVVCFDMF